MSVSIPNSVTSIKSLAFVSCESLIDIVIPNSVTSIGIGGFARCRNLATIFVEDGNAVYDSRENCNAIIETATNTLVFGCRNTKIPNSVTLIGDRAFESCRKLEGIAIPNSVTSIGDFAFLGCESLTSVTIPNSVTTIGDMAFFNCRNMSSVTIGSSVSSIGEDAFSLCDVLTSVYCSATVPPTAQSLVFEDATNQGGILYVPMESVSAYKNVAPWNSFVNIVGLDFDPEGIVEGIGADGIKVAVQSGAIEVSGAEGERVEIYNLSGQCVYSGMETTIPVAKGIYIVRVAGTVHKVIL